MNADFSGYATKSGIRCTDGRTIMQDAFADNDGQTVPLVWQHGHGDPSNVLGHALLENRKDGVYAYGFFNETPNAQNAKELIKHGDITAMSIYANNLVEKQRNVFHGAIREVSLVLAGANPGARIDNINIRHSDGEVTEMEDEAVIYGGSLEHADNRYIEHEDSGKTVKDVFDEFTEEQKNVVYYMIGAALEEAGQGGGDMAQSSIPEYIIVNQEGNEMSHNVFESDSQVETNALTHDQMSAIFSDAQKTGSLKESVIKHAGEYGITNIEELFPDAQKIRNTPDFIQRRVEWVGAVISGTHKSPFSRIKSMSADITHDEARALGYIKGNLKKEEFFSVAHRVTTPTTIYKKQKLDRDDIIDITDFDMVAWIKAEMRMMLDEEIARAVLIGDGRDVVGSDSRPNPDKISETNIRPIAKDDEFYTHKVDVADGTTPDGFVEVILRARKMYKGSGAPAFYTTEDILTDMLLVKDKIGRRLYATQAELESAMRVSKIVVVDLIETQKDDSDKPLLGILVNLRDYTIGTDKGGNVAMFDDFDIDYNQYKYLMETRMSGALTLPKSAQAFWGKLTDTAVVPDTESLLGDDE